MKLNNCPPCRSEDGPSPTHLRTQPASRSFCLWWLAARTNQRLHISAFYASAYNFIAQFVFSFVDRIMQEYVILNPMVILAVDMHQFYSLHVVGCVKAREGWNSEHEQSPRRSPHLGMQNTGPARVKTFLVIRIRIRLVGNIMAQETT